MSDQEDYDDDQMEVDPSQSQPTEDDNLDEQEDSESENESADDDDDDSDDVDEEEELYKKYIEILNQIQAQSYAYDNYVQLVQVAHQLSDLDKIRESCELFSSQFPLTPEIWIRWIQVESSIATDEVELQRVRGLFQRALNDYFSVAVAQQYAAFASKTSNPQEIWDEIIPTYGLDCMEGSGLFNEWRIYYKKSNIDSTEKIAKLQEMYLYELSLPLSGIQEVYTEFLEFAESHSCQVDWEKINEVYHKSKDNLFAMLTFEDKLVSLDEKHHQDRAAAFSEYIEKGKSILNEQMLQVLYERMVSACCLDATCWLKYIRYLQKRDNPINPNEKSPVFKQTVMDVLNRALRNCTWNTDLYIEKIRSAENSNYSKSDVTDIVQQAFEATNSDSKGHLRIWLDYLSYTKRHTDISIEKDVELLRKTIELGLDSLSRRSADPNSEFDKLCAWIEYHFLENGEEGYNYYNGIVKNAIHQNKACVWNEFALMELNRGTDFARKIYRRAIKVKNIDDFDSVMSSYKSFEYTHGSVDQIRDCEIICNRIIENYNKFVSDQYQRKNASKAPKRKSDPDTSDNVEKKKQKPNEMGAKKTVPNKKTIEQKKPVVKAAAVERDPNEKDNVTVFLSNLSYDVTEKEVLDNFTDLNVQNIDLIVAANGRGRGYGYLELSSPAEVEKALTFDRRPINGRPVYITRVSRDKGDRNSFKFADGQDRSRIFIKGLPFDSTKEELESVFGKFGQIKDIRLVTRKDGKFKGIAYIDYNHESSAKKAVETMNAQIMRNLTLTVAISNPPSKPDAPKPAIGNRPNPFSGNKESQRPPRTEAKPRLTFIPTSVQRNVTKPAPTADTNGANGGDKVSTPKSNDYFRQLLAKK